MLRLRGQTLLGGLACLQFLAQVLHFPLKIANLLAQFLFEKKVRLDHVPTDLGHQNPDNQDEEEGNHVEFSGFSKIDHQDHCDAQGKNGSNLNRSPPSEPFPIELSLLRLFLHDNHPVSVPLMIPKNIIT